MDKVDARLPLAKFSTKDSVPRTRFSRIYARDRPFVRSVLLRFGVPPRDVDDLVQDVFTVVWRRIEVLVKDLEVRPWLYAVAANLAKNYRRLRRNHKEWFFGEIPDRAMVSFDLESLIDACRHLRQIMQRVGAKVREVVVRMTLDAQSVKDVAAALFVSPKTVHSRMRSMRQSVRCLNTA